MTCLRSTSPTQAHPFYPTYFPHASHIYSLFACQFLLPPSVWPLFLFFFFLFLCLECTTFFSFCSQNLLSIVLHLLRPWNSSSWEVKAIHVQLHKIFSNCKLHQSSKTCNSIHLTLGFRPCKLEAGSLLYHTWWKQGGPIMKDWHFQLFLHYRHAK